MATQTYAEKLKNPLWQRKRLEILQRDGFRCTDISCLSETKTLHVHHLDYIKCKEPWEYPNEYFTTLCEDCHKEETESRKIKEVELISQFRLKLKDSFIQSCAVDLFKNLSSEDLSEIIYMLWELSREEINLNTEITGLYHYITDPILEKIKYKLSKKGVSNG